MRNPIEGTLKISFLLLKKPQTWTPSQDFLYPHILHLLKQPSPTLQLLALQEKSSTLWTNLVLMPRVCLCWKLLRKEKKLAWAWDIFILISILPGHGKAHCPCLYSDMAVTGQITEAKLWNSNNFMCNTKEMGVPIIFQEENLPFSSKQRPNRKENHISLFWRLRFFFSMRENKPIFGAF